MRDPSSTVRRKYNFRVTFAELLSAGEQGNDTTPSLVHRLPGRTLIRTTARVTVF